MLGCVERNNRTLGLCPFRNWQECAGIRIKHTRVCSDTLAYSRFSAEQEQRAWHDAAAEHAVELARAGGQPPARERLHARQRQRLREPTARKRRTAAFRWWARGRDHRLDEGVPFATVGATAHPLRA